MALWTPPVGIVGTTGTTLPFENRLRQDFRDVRWKWDPFLSRVFCDDPVDAIQEPCLTALEAALAPNLPHVRRRLAFVGTHIPESLEAESRSHI